MHRNNAAMLGLATCHISRETSYILQQRLDHFVTYS